MNPEDTQIPESRKPVADFAIASEINSETDISEIDMNNNPPKSQNELFIEPLTEPAIEPLMEPLTESPKGSELQLGKPLDQPQKPNKTSSVSQINLSNDQQELNTALNNLVSEALTQLEQRKQTLQLDVEKLERRRDRIQQEMRTSFAGVSQDLAIRVQGFKDYLVGSLQDLASTAEQLDLVPDPVPAAPEQTVRSTKKRSTPEAPPTAIMPQFTEQGFQEQARQIRQLLDQYRTTPDYYGPAWQLRRTFEPIHAKRVANWFFAQGGRGALRTMGSRLQNILITSAIISILRTLYDRQLCTLILANTPERLGDWRRGLQDCLGIDRRDFGPEQGIVLFDDANVVAQKADRLVQQGKLPLIIVDDSEDKISLSLLQYPLWLAFAPEPSNQPPAPVDQF
ncbi:MAG: DUF3086 domain-containing protein [Oscillatoriales cyanobacterium RM2_1_1]|nr:DUF3086 domain-containing protein [Oscillatoriales cyanobacterium SM2_3_0]NJO46457.1 DUF3086 domain-containing protein [Oscillatoriales cyanobacterium RM2_1_1]